METHDDYQEAQARADRRWNVGCVVSLLVTVALVVAAAAWVSAFLESLGPL